MYIKDLQSKFGTLVLAQKDIEFKNKKINLQIGRSYIEFTLTKENSKTKKEYSIFFLKVISFVKIKILI